ncbi:MAG: hypothetical protein XD91_0876 [Clostridiales bacterium 38_11]|nr:MAG: hypothetical protein XD91_0876 [Clostridiales bacterium 38_11]HBH12075.1 ribosomal-processing cysteine protease Prp [Clostridiales bacterium]
MIEIVIVRDKNEYLGYEISGHAGFDESGYDIICSAVSILAYTALNSMATVAEIAEWDMSYRIDESVGDMSLLLKRTNIKTDIILKIFETGIKLLLDDYSQYISLDYKEVWR